MLASRYFVPPPRKVRGKSFAEVSLKKVFRHKSLARAPSKTRKVEQIKVRRASTVSLYSSENSCVSPYPSASARRNRKKIANKLPLKSERAISTPFFLGRASPCSHGGVFTLLAFRLGKKVSHFRCWKLSIACYCTLQDGKG